VRSRLKRQAQRLWLRRPPSLSAAAVAAAAGRLSSAGKSTEAVFKVVAWVAAQGLPDAALAGVFESSCRASFTARKQLAALVIDADATGCLPGLPGGEIHLDRANQVRQFFQAGASGGVVVRAVRCWESVVAPQCWGGRGGCGWCWRGGGFGLGCLGSGRVWLEQGFSRRSW